MGWGRKRKHREKRQQEEMGQKEVMTWKRKLNEEKKAKKEKQGWRKSKVGSIADVWTFGKADQIVERSRDRGKGLLSVANVVATTPASHISPTALAVLLPLIQFPTNTHGLQPKMVPSSWAPANIWEAQRELQAPDTGLLQTDKQIQDLCLSFLYL